MVQVPQNIYNAVKPYSNVPDPIWESIVYFESDFNPVAVGDGPQSGGYSYGLFQLHVGDNGAVGQGNSALNLIQQQTGLTGQAAITYLLQHPDIQAKVGMVDINTAWNALRNSFNATDTSWWLEFCSQSGHPGGSPSNGTTIAYVTNFMRKVVNPNLFGIQQINAGAGPETKTTQDNTWLQALINMPPHQPCNIIWRRSCPGAKAAYEGGMDLPSPGGTKVYALGDGIVIGAGYFWHPNGNPGHGVVTIRTHMPDSSLADIYYQHIQIAPSIILCGQTGGQLYNGVVGPAPTHQPITAGQLLGTVVDGVNEVEVGVNADQPYSQGGWGGIWGGTNPAGPWADDPEDIIRSLMQHGGGSSNNTISTGNINFDAWLNSQIENTKTGVDVLTQNPGLKGPLILFNNVQQFKPFSIPTDKSPIANVPIVGGIEQGASYPVRVTIGTLSFLLNNVMAFFIRSVFVLLALVIIVSLIINITSKEISEELDENGNLLPVAEAAMI